jgi:hypothetical protein
MTIAVESPGRSSRPPTLKRLVFFGAAFGVDRYL